MWPAAPEGGDMMHGSNKEVPQNHFYQVSAAQVSRRWILWCLPNYCERSWESDYNSGLVSAFIQWPPTRAGEWLNHDWENTLQHHGFMMDIITSWNTKSLLGQPEGVVTDPISGFGPWCPQQRWSHAAHSQLLIRARTWGKQKGLPENRARRQISLHPAFGTHPLVFYQYAREKEGPNGLTTGSWKVLQDSSRPPVSSHSKATINHILGNLAICWGR